jgi:hypothetical protein
MVGMAQRKENFWLLMKANSASDVMKRKISSVDRFSTHPLQRLSVLPVIHPMVQVSPDFWLASKKIFVFPAMRNRKRK